jgi:hypothetical protein
MSGLPRGRVDFGVQKRHDTFRSTTNSHMICGLTSNTAHALSLLICLVASPHAE